MSRRPSLCRKFALGCLVFGLSQPSAAEPKEDVRSNQIRFVLQARSARGEVRCGLFEREGWLTRPLASATAKAVAVQRDGRTQFFASCVFKKIGKGEYAASAFQDSDGNGKLTTNLFGLPSEDYCASNDARNPIGPPSFRAAKFPFRGGSLELNARLH